MTAYIKPVFHVFLMIFYFKRTKRFNVLLLFTFACGMLGEFLIAKGFLENFKIVSLFFTSFFIGLTILLIPIIRVTPFRFWRHSVGQVIIGVVGLIAILLSTYFLTSEYLPEYGYNVMFLTSIAFFLASCFYVSFFSKHPNSFYLFIVGAAYLIDFACSILHQTVLPYQLLLGLANTSEIIAQYFFVLFLAQISLKSNYEELPM